MYKLHSLQHPDWYRTGTSYCYFYFFEIIHHHSVISKINPSFFTIKEGSTFLSKPLFNSLYAPFGSPSSGRQKPSGTRGCNRPTVLNFLPLRLSCKESSTFSPSPSSSGSGDVTALLGARNRYALRLADHQRSSPGCAGWDRLEITCYHLDKWGVYHQYSVPTILQVVTPISFLKKVILYQYCRRLT